MVDSLYVQGDRLLKNWVYWSKTENPASALRFSSLSGLLAELQGGYLKTLDPDSALLTDRALARLSKVCFITAEVTAFHYMTNMPLRRMAQHSKKIFNFTMSKTEVHSRIEKEVIFVYANCLSESTNIAA